MAHKKGVGSSKNGRDSQSKRRGAKAHDNQFVTGGSIIIRQCGNKWYPGRDVGQGRDFTLFAKVAGHVKFERRLGKKIINIIPADEFAQLAAAK